VEAGGAEALAEAIVNRLATITVAAEEEDTEEDTKAEGTEAEGTEAEGTEAKGTEVD